jgi:hypothetical protein
LNDTRYDPSIFEQSTMEAAQKIILMPEAGLGTSERWVQETDWLMERLDFEDTSLILDIGCGVGRIAAQLHCPMIGVDISTSMRLLATQNVDRSNFAAISPTMFHQLVEAGMTASTAIAFWALQHMILPDLLHTLRLLGLALPSKSLFWTLDRSNRCVPIRNSEGTGWADDGVPLPSVIAGYGFALETEEEMPAALCSPGAYFRKWRRTSV